MYKRDTVLLLDDMLQSTQKIKRYVSGLDYNSFTADDKTLDTVELEYQSFCHGSVPRFVVATFTL